jgi:hypothetical protein
MPRQARVVIAARRTTSASARDYGDTITVTLYEMRPDAAMPVYFVQRHRNPRADDKGVFVMLDPASPTRLFSGLPPGVEIQRMTLVEAIETVSAFLAPADPSLRP